jgi:hypothetical protein
MNLTEALARLCKADKIASPWGPGMRVICTEDPDFGGHAVGEAYRIREVNGPLCFGQGEGEDGGARDFAAPGFEEALWRWRTRGEPDLTDAATVGCLLALAREAAGCPWLSVVGGPDGFWRIDAEDGPEWVRDLHSLATEAEALSACIIAAAEARDT